MEPDHAVAGRLFHLRCLLLVDHAQHRAPGAPVDRSRRPVGHDRLRHRRQLFFGHGPRKCLADGHGGLVALDFECSGGIGLDAGRQSGIRTAFRYGDELLPDLGGHSGLAVCGLLGSCLCHRVCCDAAGDSPGRTTTP